MGRSGGGCENCSSCGIFRTGDPYDMYQPYIDGKKKLSEMNQEFIASYLK